MLHNIAQKTPNEQCFECGKQAAHNHHVVPKSIGGRKTVPLCVECHDKIHAVGNILSRGNMHKASIVARRPNKLTWDMAIKILNLRGEGKSIRQINKVVTGVSIDTIQKTIIGEGSLPSTIREIQKTLCDQCLMRPKGDEIRTTFSDSSQNVSPPSTCS